MTLDVYRGRKTTIQQYNHSYQCKLLSMKYFVLKLVISSKAGISCCLVCFLVGELGCFFVCVRRCVRGYIDVIYPDYHV